MKFQINFADHLIRHINYLSPPYGSIFLLKYLLIWNESWMKIIFSKGRNIARLVRLNLLFPFDSNLINLDLSRKQFDSPFLPSAAASSDCCHFGVIVCVMHLQIFTFKTEKWTRNRTSTSDEFL